MFSGSMGQNVWEKQTESHFFLKLVVKWAKDQNSFGGMRCLCTLSTSPQTPASKPLRPELHFVVWCCHSPSARDKMSSTRLPPLNQQSTESCMHIFWDAHTVSVLGQCTHHHILPCIPWLLFSRAYCLYIAFLTRDATLRTILKSMQLHKAHLYDAFTPCHSFLKHRITFKSAFRFRPLVCPYVFYSNATDRVLRS